MAARRGVKAGFAIRVNPDVDASTHPYISTGLSRHKFGIAIAEAPAVYEQARRFANLAAEGVSCHIGSQILDPSPILEAVEKVLALACLAAVFRGSRSGTWISAAGWASRTTRANRRRRSALSSPACGSACATSG